MIFIGMLNRRIDALVEKIDRCIETLKVQVQVELNKQVIKDLERLEEKVATLEAKR